MTLALSCAMALGTLPVPALAEAVEADGGDMIQVEADDGMQMEVVGTEEETTSGDAVGTTLEEGALSAGYDSGEDANSEVEPIEEEFAVADDAAPSGEVEADGAGDDALSAQTAAVASGTWGTCPWEISTGGKLTVRPGTGASQEGLPSSSPWADYVDEVTSVEFVRKGSERVVLPANCYGLFSYMNKLISVDVSSADASKVTNMGGLFSGCYSLSSLEISGWDTSSATNMDWMFDGCSSLESIDLSGWKTSSVTDMSGMFSGCSKLASLDVSRWDTSKVTSMFGVFWGCSSLVSLDLSRWDMSSVTIMTYMFDSCSSLSSLDISGWNASSVTSMSWMFSACPSLESLDLSGLDTSSVTDMLGVFSGCSSLSELRVGPRYRIIGADMFPDATAESGKWWSETDSRWYSKNEIVTGRSAVADTYTSYVPTWQTISVTELSIDVLPAQIYTGRALRPKPTVRSGDVVLSEGIDYALSYRDNVNAGTVTVIVTGKGAYTGATSVTFKINKAASKVSLAAQTKTYTGKAVAYTGKVTRTGSTGKVTYKYYSDSACTKEVKAANVKAVGTYYVKATLAADANHKAATSAAARFTVAKAASTIKLAAQTRAYTGKAIAYTGKVTKTGSTGKVTYKYYSDAKCSKEVKAASVKAAGTYYVKATVAADANHKAATSAAAKLTVKAPTVTYRTHVQGIGDQEWKKNGQATGTFGQSRRLEGIWVKLSNKPVTGSIRYRTHVQGIGDQEWRSEGQMSGTSGQSRRLEAIQIELTGDMAKGYDVYYRVHAQRLGWMGWAKNGARAGTAGYSYRLEALQIVLVPKGAKAPAANYGGHQQNTASAFMRR